MHLEGKTALVSGAASGIGHAAAQTLADAGASVILADINITGAEARAQAIGSGASALFLDVSSEGCWQDALASIEQKAGHLDILVNCAGIGVAGNFEDTSLADWQRLLDINLTGVFLGCKHGLRLLRKAPGDAAIVNISSIAGLVGGEDIAAYSASKGGVTMLSKSVALHCARHARHVRCNSVHPTYVDSEMLDPVAEQFSSRSEMLEGMAAEVPIGRVATPQDIADVIHFLVSEQARMITGAQLVVDGGQLAGLPARHSV